MLRSYQRRHAQRVGESSPWYQQFLWEMVDSAEADLLRKTREEEELAMEVEAAVLRIEQEYKKRKRLTRSRNWVAKRRRAMGPRPQWLIDQDFRRAFDSAGE
ncbi:MAG: hypothetical protein [Cressdnaviricota sp.]|nr:MAG: hypothetical protein [Cressdnaviricota sp.]